MYNFIKLKKKKNIFWRNIFDTKYKYKCSTSALIDHTQRQKRSKQKKKNKYKKREKLLTRHRSRTVHCPARRKFMIIREISSRPVGNSGRKTNFPSALTRRIFLAFPTTRRRFFLFFSRPPPMLVVTQASSFSAVRLSVHLSENSIGKFSKVCSMGDKGRCTVMVQSGRKNRIELMSFMVLFFLY